MPTMLPYAVAGLLLLAFAAIVAVIFHLGRPNPEWAGLAELLGKGR